MKEKGGKLLSWQAYLAGQQLLAFMLVWGSVTCLKVRNYLRYICINIKKFPLDLARPDTISGSCNISDLSTTFTSSSHFCFFDLSTFPAKIFGIAFENDWRHCTTVLFTKTQDQNKISAVEYVSKTPLPSASSFSNQRFSFCSERRWGYSFWNWVRYRVNKQKRGSSDENKNPCLWRCQPF